MVYRLEEKRERERESYVSKVYRYVPYPSHHITHPYNSPEQFSSHAREI
jgi:hypothetical protein